MDSTATIACEASGASKWSSPVSRTRSSALSTTDRSADACNSDAQSQASSFPNESADHAPIPIPCNPMPPCCHVRIREARRSCERPLPGIYEALPLPANVSGDVWGADELLLGSDPRRLDDRASRDMGLPDTH